MPRLLPAASKETIDARGWERLFHRLDRSGGPIQQSGAEDGRLEGEAMRGVGCRVAGQGTDPVQPVGDGADPQMQAAGGLGGDPAGLEVGGQGIQQRLPAPAGLSQGGEDPVDELGDGP